MAFELQSEKIINKMIDTAITHTAKGDGLIHEAASQALGHAQASGDARPLDRLMKGLGKSVRVEGLRVWVETYSPVRWNGDGKVGLLKETMKGYVAFDVQTAFDNPFWTLKAADEKVSKPLDLFALVATIKGMRAKVEKAQAKNQFEGDEQQALRFLGQMEAFVDGFIKVDPIRDGAYDPADPENAKEDAIDAEFEVIAGATVGATLDAAINAKDFFADDAWSNGHDATSAINVPEAVPAPLPAPRKARANRLAKAA